MSGLSEADTHAKLVNPAIYKKGWTEDHMKRFVATTVELLTTGVDVKPVRNIAFFKYVASPIAFY